MADDNPYNFRNVLKFSAVFAMKVFVSWKALGCACNLDSIKNSSSCFTNLFKVCVVCEVGKGKGQQDLWLMLIRKEYAKRALIIGHVVGG